LTSPYKHWIPNLLLVNTIDSQTININRVDSIAKDSPTNNYSQADLSTVLNGNIVLIAGNKISVNEGGDLNKKGLYAGGAGNILLQTKKG
jgi:hypothetical protein